MYKIIIEQYFILSLITSLVHGQNNSPCHDEKTVKQFFETENVGAMACLIQSSDLNLIENL